MILLLGGIRESREAAEMLLDADREVLFCMATDMPFPLPDSPRIERRAGELDRETFTSLLRDRPVRAVLDVTHPYAGRISDMARELCAAEGVPFYCYLRPPVINSKTENVIIAADHAEAARLACERGEIILLTIGTRSLETYVRRARSAGCRLYIRTLPRPESRQACYALGLEEEQIISEGRADSVPANISAIRHCGADVLVTKDSGEQGGAHAKRIAAQRTDSCLIAVERPHAYPSDVYHSVERAVEECLHAQQA